MSTQPTQDSSTLLPRRRPEHVALAGIIIQAVCLLVTLLLARPTASKGLWLLTPQMGIATLFWLATYLRLRLRRCAVEESEDLAAAERRRQSQGMEALFADAQEGPAIRSLRHMDRYLAPAISLILALLLLGPTVYFLAISWDTGLGEALAKLPALHTKDAYGVAAGAAFIALTCFVFATYAAGLSREKGAALLRAGAGNMLSSALFLFLAAIFLAISKRDWVQDWPDQMLGVAVYAWMTLQAIEMLINFTFDLYRPRLAGVEARPVYDSRLSGLLAEPQGLFHTFAHTMDYQFGFKISETWFFKFLEKALAPLILIQLLTLYLLTCFVVVRPGEAAIIERWGAPRGVDRLPVNDAEWDSLAPPLEPGLHLKWPWPIECAFIYNRERIDTISVGYTAVDEEEAREKAEKLAETVVCWDAEHVEDEIKYLMPLPEAAEPTADKKPVDTDTEEKAPDALLLSGEFVIRYRVGASKDRPGDIYRYAYRFQNPRQAVRDVFEREVTAFLAGADFWQVLARDPNTIRDALHKNLARTVRQEGLGLEIVSLNIHNLHPPVGDVGKAFQKVLSSRQEKESLIYKGETEAIRVLSAAPGEADRIRTEAESYRAQRSLIAEGEGKRFIKQLQAYRAAPAAYTMRVHMRALEEILRDVRKIVLPRSMIGVVDNREAFSPDVVEEQKAIIKAGENP